MEFSNNAQKVLERRYLLRNADGEVVETIEEMFFRVANYIAGGDELYLSGTTTEETAQEFYDLMISQKFMPNSPTLMNAGKQLGQLSACFVLPIDDTMEGIFDTLKNAALIHKSGGGTGFSFSRLRAAGSTVASTGGVASGPVSFMKVFNAATEAVKQGGTRRGANMGILRVDHPDILDFISCKKDLKELTNFNISVGITEAFMRAVLQNDIYDLIDPRDKKIVGSLSAKGVFEKIVELAWESGEPGIVFLDRLNRDNPVPAAGEIESTNPCGEQPLLPYESCNLGSINLAKFVEDGEINYDDLERCIETAVHFLDNVIDVNCYPLPIIDEVTKATRKIGLGVMGFADLLYILNVPYNSDDAVILAEKLMKFIQEKAKAASSRLALIRGNFPLYDKSTFAEAKIPMRNATVTTIAPTGTISIICNASSGIEPVFALSYIRNVMDNDHMMEVHPYFEQYMKLRGFYTSELMEQIANEGTLKYTDLPEDVKRKFVTAHDILPEYHVKMQAAFQTFTDNAVSKTVNFSQDASKEDIAEVYLLAYEMGLKGVTIYRDKSREAQVLNVKEVNVAAASDGLPKFDMQAMYEEDRVEEYTEESIPGVMQDEVYTTEEIEEIISEDQPEVPEPVAEPEVVAEPVPEEVVEQPVEQIVEEPQPVQQPLVMPEPEPVKSELPPVQQPCGASCETCVDKHDCDDSIIPRERPSITFGLTEKVKIGCGNLYITVNFDEKGICEVFTNLGRAGGCPSQSEATSRLISTSLRAGVDLQSVVEQMRGIRCHATLRRGDLNVLSCPDAIGRALERAVKLWEKQKIVAPETVAAPTMNGDKQVCYCPECGGTVTHEGGCIVCRECGYSKCG